MTITKNRLKKLEEKAKGKFIKDEIIIKYQIPNGKLITLVTDNDIAVIPNDEAKNIKEVKGIYLTLDRVGIQKYLPEIGNKKLYEREDFVILSEKPQTNE